MLRRTPRRTRRVRTAHRLSAAALLLLLALSLTALVAEDATKPPRLAEPSELLSSPHTQPPRDAARKRPAGLTAHRRDAPRPAHHAHADLAASATRLLPSAHDVLSERSLVLVVELGRDRARISEVVPKRLPYRLLNGRQLGRYLYQLEDVSGRVLHEGKFEVLDLCPLRGARHVDPHVAGHVVLAHTASVLVRVPDLPAARTIVFKRALPEIDLHPLFLGRARLQKG